MPTRTLIVSDLHISEDEQLGIFAGAKALPELLRSFSDAPTHLILNGDALDFLQNADPLTLDAKRSAQRASDILEAKPNEPVVKALAGLLEAGGKITFRCGNHDLELALPEVQAAVRKGLSPGGQFDGQIGFETGAQPRRIDINGVGLLITHGDSDDRFNRVRYDDLEAAAQGKGTFTYPPGSLLVKSLLNPLKLKHRMRFADLLKPDFEGAVLAALAVNPGALGLLAHSDTAKILLGLLTNARAPETSALEGGLPAPEEPTTTDPAIDGIYNSLLERVRLAEAWPAATEEPATALEAFGLGSAMKKLRYRLAREGLKAYARTQRAMAGASGEKYFSLEPGKDEWNGAVDLAAKYKVSAVIQGHTHSARWRSDTSLTYVNTGTWIWLMRVPSETASVDEWVQWLDELRAHPDLKGNLRLARLETHLTALRIEPAPNGALLSLIHCNEDGTTSAGPSTLLVPRSQPEMSALESTSAREARVQPPSAAPPSAALESILFRVKSSPDTPPNEVAERVARATVPSWGLRSFWDNPSDFELSPPDSKAPAHAVAWQIVHALRAHPDVDGAAPLFATSMGAPPTITAAAPTPPQPPGSTPPQAPTPPPASAPSPAPDSALESAVVGLTEPPDPKTEKAYEWSLDSLGIRASWGLSPEGQSQGAHILIAHPDTGYTDHGEIKDSLLTGLGWDFVRDRADPRDELERGPVLLFPGHGTATASVIASDEGPNDRKHVTGVAPKAKLIPLRVSRSVVQISMRALTKAIRWAINRGCHVISISLGGLWNRYLHEAIQDAVREGIIVLAAAGNYVGLIAWPAAYDEVIAVGATTYKNEPWSGTSRGPAVDVSAPGAAVWCAHVDDKKTPVEFVVQRGDGTSFAVAAVAGVAALWLAHHGRNKLIEKYGTVGMVKVFKQLLQKTGKKPQQPGGPWDESLYGACIVNAKALLEEPLPDTTPAHFSQKKISLWSSLFSLTPFPFSALSALESTNAGFPAGPDASASASLEEELLFHLALNPELQPPAPQQALESASAPALDTARLQAIASPSLAACLAAREPALLAGRPPLETSAPETSEQALREAADALRLRLLTEGNADRAQWNQLLKMDQRWLALTAPAPAAPAPAAPEPAAGATGATAAAPAVRAQKMGLDTTGVEATIALRMDYVPTSIVHALDWPLVTVTTRQVADRPKARLRLSAWVEGFSARAVKTVELDYKNTPAEIDLMPTFLPEALRSLTEITRATLHVEVRDLDKQNTERDQSLPLWLLAKTSAPLSMLDPKTGSPRDLVPHLGSWVTPNAPAVMRLLREACADPGPKQIVGYQVNAAGVEQQVKAIFAAVHRRDILYVNSVLSRGNVASAFFQRVRLPSESLETQSANCIDGTVLLASLLEAASLQPALVVIPGHAFLAWRKERNSNNWDYLETTLIWTGDFERARNAARQTAAQYEAAASPAMFRRLPLTELRAKGIFPAE